MNEGELGLWARVVGGPLRLWTFPLGGAVIFKMNLQFPPEPDGKSRKICANLTNRD